MLFQVFHKFIPGSYKTITIGDNSKVVLRPGIYNLENFKFDTDVKIYVSVDALNRLEINVRDTLQIADRCRFLLSDANTSKYIQIYSHQDFQNRLGTDIQLAGSFYFPRAGVVFSSRGTFINGGVYANKIQLEPDGQITSGSVSLHSDNLTTAVYPALTGEDTLFFDFKAHRSCFLDTMQDIIIRYGDSTIKFISSGIRTPVNTQLSLKFQFFPMGTVNALKLFYNDGHGLMNYADSIPVSFNTINSLGFYYTTETGADNRQVGLDNILLSCTHDTCPQIIIKSQPENKELYTGERALFSCEVESTSVYPVFQWYRDNKPIPHANSPVYSISSVDTSDDGALFHCSISNKCYSNISRNARLTVLSCNPPVIITQSVSDTVSIHDTIRLSVNALGLGLRYQWQESNRPIESATDSVYTINGILSDHNLNEYSVIITNSCGKNAISKPITLYVRNSIPCKITKQPVGDTVEEKDYFITEAGVSCENGTITWL
ncbi:MAG: immunoglobulin domain-containing protein, partial [Fibrobacter sp.]|nr:immunoglobulin domain-containing protein [Fibrobacter sp.]